MINLRPLWIIVVLFLFISCGGKQKKDIDLCTTEDLVKFELSQFKDIDLSKEEHIITDDPDILGVPSAILALNDSIVAIRSKVGGYQIILLNIETGEHQFAVKTGEGPLEMLSVTNMTTPDNETVWLSGFKDRKIMTVKWNLSGEKALTEFKYRSPEELLRGVTDGKGGMIGLPAVSRSLRTISLDNSGMPIDSLEVFPITVLPDSVVPNNFMFQADMAYNSVVNRLVIANLLWNEIGIYSLSDGSDKSLKYSLDEDIKIKRVDRGYGYSCIPSPYWLMFSQLCAGEKSFTVGFCGVEVKTQEDFEHGISKVLEFDWDGIPLRCFSFKDEIVAYDIDFKNKIIYTLENRPEPTVVKYELK